MGWPGMISSSGKRSIIGVPFYSIQGKFTQVETGREWGSHTE